MKKLLFTTVITLLLASGSISSAQSYPKEYLGLPGDNLNLYAVMDIFRDSETLEGFEKSLNNPDKVINNLDLNGDKYVDYIFVKDYVDGNVHNIVMSVAVNEKEFQDVAVFIVEKQRDGSVVIQLIGDEALYGKNYIIEPNYGDTPNPGYKGATAGTGNAKVVTTNYYHVSTWPVVSYIYTPTYVVWHSPYYYDYYPVYWVRWSPHYWHYYYGYHYNWYGHYYSYYRIYPHHRYPRYHSFYYSGVRHYSPQVGVRIREGYYRTTYSRPDEQSRGENLYHKTASSRSHGNNSPTGRNENVNTGRNPNVGNNTGTRSQTVNKSRINSPDGGSPVNNSNNSRSFRTEDPSTDTRNKKGVVDTRSQNTAPARRSETSNSTSRPSGSSADVKKSNTRSSNPPAEVRRSNNTRSSESIPSVKSSNNSSRSGNVSPSKPDNKRSAASGRNVSTPSGSRGSAATPSRNNSSEKSRNSTHRGSSSQKTPGTR